MVPLESGILASADSVWTEPRKRVLHEAVNVVVGPLHKCELTGSVIKTRELV